MARKWKNRPEGSTWGDFGPSDQLGRLNLLTRDKVLQGVAEVREGINFCLSLPLNLPGGTKLNPRRHPPQLKPVIREGEVAFNLALGKFHPQLTDVTCDDALLIYNQYSTQWDSFAHMGAMFDADGDGKPEKVFYNGHSPVGPDGRGTHGEVGAVNLGIQNMAESCVQGRGVLLDFHHHFGATAKSVGYDDLMRLLDADGIEVETGDMVLMHTGFAQLLMDMKGDPDTEALRASHATLNGRDERVLQWVTDSGLAILVSDNRAVETEPAGPHEVTEPGPLLPLHQHCLFKLGVHLGEMWYLTQLAAWLRAHGRYRFLLTAPPLRMPGAVGSPATPVATV